MFLARRFILRKTVAYAVNSKKVKVKWSRYRLGVAQKVGRGIALLFHDRGTRRGWVVSSTPWPHFIPGKSRYPFYRRLGGPQGRSERAENIVTTGIRSRTVQPVVSRYTDWATGPIYAVIAWYKTYHNCIHNRLPEDETSGSKHTENIKIKKII